MSASDYRGALARIATASLDGEDIEQHIVQLSRRARLCEADIRASVDEHIDLIRN